MLRRRSRPSPDALWSADPAERLAAAQQLGRDAKAARRVAPQPDGWPPLSPAARNAWLLLVTTKPPQWRDPLLEFPEAPLTLGEPHPGFLYPDPIGFWTEVRRWTHAVAGVRRLAPTDAVAVSGLVHLGDEPARLALAVRTLQPRVVLFLDEAAWTVAALETERTELHHVPDPHRPGQVYQGLWGRVSDDDGTRIVGKAPQHPAMHRLYDASEMDRFLYACPVD